ncbi:putative fmn binding protein [Neofusicoccum parvum UCRNP2]|uniref:Putative fmn binding protein n=1 Tax=Botryosphaeria parva (strain UCR-NP2) TaxID=1287680 RepID=R1H377_BOTPV|nr:putative fmn binding protein [Neofusicoccum parvum UCRNP2]
MRARSAQSACQGNVQVDGNYLGANGDIALDTSIEPELLSSWKRWAQASHISKAPVVMQINHPGRQSPIGAGKRSLCAKNIAPSPIPLNLGSGMIAKSAVSLMFGTPKEMDQQDIDTVVQQFAIAARLAAESGFSGVEIHAAHGYLLSTFLTAETNKRTDQYGGSPRNRARIIVDIVHAIHNTVPPSFCVGVKLNSADHQSSQELSASIEQIDAIAAAGIDFLEVSGGTYEDPKMMETTAPPKPSSRTAAREAFFLDFAHAIRAHVPALPLLVTGGFRSRLGMEAALTSSACDLVGVGRPAVLAPALPKQVIFNERVPDEEARLVDKKVEAPFLAKLSGVKAVGSGATSAWYSTQIRLIPGLA